MEDEKILNLKELMGELSVQEFRNRFNTQTECLELLANAKWSTGFVCRHCGNEKYCTGRTLFSRRCTRCKKEESATAHTIFHHCRIELPKAFEIAYLICGSPELPATDISTMLKTRHMTCLNFKKRILKCIQSEGKLVSELPFK